MGVGKWIGGFFGLMSGGPLGALAGYAIGWLFDKHAESLATNEDGYDSNTYQSHNYSSAQQYEAQRNSFLFSLLVLSSYIIKADGKIMHSEMEFVRRFLRNNFGEAAQIQGEEIMLRLFERQKAIGNEAYKATIHDVCMQLALNLEYSQRLQLINYLVTIAQADGNVPQSEIDALMFIAANLGISIEDFNSMFNLSNGGNNIDAAYKVLGIEPTASDDEVKSAYRRMALKHHPDRVATLGDDVRKAAEQKFQEINAAKETIYKARGL